MKRKNIEEIGVFNVLLIGENPHAISIADNIHATFQKGIDMKNTLSFNIIGDIDGGDTEEWFHEFIFDLTSTVGRFNNIVISKKFKEWMVGKKPGLQGTYMSMLLKALNFVIVDISTDDEGEYETVFDYDIPHCHFNDTKDFLLDTLKWIDGQIGKLNPKMGTIRLVRSLSGNNIPYLGDVFGCLSGKKYSTIVHADKMRFDVPILYDEFCSLMKDKPVADIRDSIVTRSNSALAVFLK